MALPQRYGVLVFGRAIAGECRLVVRKLDHHEAGAAGALHGLMAAGADHIAGTVLAERNLVCRHIILVAFRIRHLDLREPISFCHWMFPQLPMAAAISATMAAAAALGSGAPRIGRPTTR